MTVSTKIADITRHKPPSLCEWLKVGSVHLDVSTKS